MTDNQTVLIGVKTLFIPISTILNLKIVQILFYSNLIYE